MRNKKMILIRWYKKTPRKGSRYIPRRLRREWQHNKDSKKEIKKVVDM